MSESTVGETLKEVGGRLSDMRIAVERGIALPIALPSVLPAGARAPSRLLRVLVVHYAVGKNRTFFAESRFAREIWRALPATDGGASSRGICACAHRNTVVEDPVLIVAAIPLTGAPELSNLALRSPYFA